MKNIYIQLIDERGKSHFHNIPLKSTVTVGKSASCDIKLSGKEISQMHALIEAFEEDAVFIRSLDVKKKVMVNGKPVDREKIGFKDIVTIGSCELQVKKVAVEEASEKPTDKASIDKKDQDSLTKTLETLAPSQKEKTNDFFDSSISDDEIESSITIPEEPSKETREEDAKPEHSQSVEHSSVKESTISREVVRASRSLRVKHYWYDLILDDRLHPLLDPVTIGHSKRSTYVIPQNGLSKKFPLFSFEKLQPYLTFNENLKGHIDREGKGIIDLSEVKAKLKDVESKGNDSRLMLKFEDKGEILHQNMKFEFEFIQTPAPAKSDRIFSRLDKTYKKSLIVGACLFLLLLLIVLFVPKREIFAEKEEERFARVDKRLLLPAARPTPTPPPRIIKMGGTQGTEGEGRRLAGKEGSRGRESKQGKEGKQTKSQIDLIRDQGIGALMLFRKSGFFKEISKGGGGGDLKSATGVLKAGRPDADIGGKGSGLRNKGGTGGGGTFVGSGPGGLGTKGDGLGAKGTGRAAYGDKGEARVTTADIVSDEIGIQGEMDPSIIERLIRNNLGYIKWCYERELNTTPDLEGKIVVDFIIGPEGLVTSSRAKTSSMHNPKVEACIARRIKTIRFPSPGAGIVQVFYPFMFRVAGGF